MTEKLNRVLHARVSFLTDIGMPAEQSSSVEQIRKTLTCLNKMIPQIQTLRVSQTKILPEKQMKISEIGIASS